MLNSRAHEVSERNRKEYEMELILQKVDNIKAQEQMDTLREFEEEYVSRLTSRKINQG